MFVTMSSPGGECFAPPSLQEGVPQVLESQIHGFHVQFLEYLGHSLLQREGGAKHSPPGEDMVTNIIFSSENHDFSKILKIISDHPRASRITQDHLW